MVKHSELLSDVMTSVRQIPKGMPSTQASASTATSVPQISVPLAEPRLPPPQRFLGDPSACCGFLTQCSLTFELQPSSFPSDRAKIAYVITRVRPSPGQQLSGRPRAPSAQVILHLKRNSNGFLIIPSAAVRHLNDCCPSSKVVALLQNMPSIFALLKPGVVGTMSLSWCASRTVFLRHSKMSLQHESLPVISRPSLTWRSDWIIV